jgi:hypothetical protein
MAKNTVMEYTIIQMAENMKANIKMILNAVMEHIIIKMARNLLVYGKMVKMYSYHVLCAQNHEGRRRDNCGCAAIVPPSRRFKNFNYINGSSDI